MGNEPWDWRVPPPHCGSPPARWCSTAHGDLHRLRTSPGPFPLVGPASPQRWRRRRRRSTTRRTTTTPTTYPVPAGWSAPSGTSTGSGRCRRPGCCASCARHPRGGTSGSGRRCVVPRAGPSRSSTGTGDPGRASSTAWARSRCKQWMWLRKAYLPWDRRETDA